jgi:hypothetical protein
VPSPHIGTDASAGPDGGAAPKRIKPDAAAASDDAAGLFPEPKSDARLRATKPTANPEHHIADIVRNEDRDEGPEHANNKEKAFARTLAEGITPDEFESDLRNATWPPGTDDDDRLDKIDQISAEYADRYKKAVAEQNKADGKGGDSTGTDGGDSSANASESDSTNADDTAKPDAAAPSTDTQPDDAPDAGAPDAGAAKKYPPFTQQPPPKVKKGENLHTVTAPNGQQFHRGSKRDYTHAVVHEDDQGNFGQLSFNGSAANAQRNIADYRKRGFTGKMHILPTTSTKNDGTAPLPDKTTKAMWKANPDRAAAKLPAAEKAEYGALSPAKQDDYARGRVAGEDHPTALSRVGGGVFGRNEDGTPKAADNAPVAPDASTPDDANTPAAPAPGKPQVGDSLDVEKAMPQGVNDVTEAPWHRPGQSLKFGDKKVENLPISSLNRTQDNANTLGSKKVEANTSDEPVNVVRHQGKNWLFDGHHRAVGAMASGRDNIPARVYDMDAADNGVDDGSTPDAPGVPDANVPDGGAPDANAPAAPDEQNAKIQKLANALAAGKTDQLPTTSTDDLNALDTELARRADLLGHPDAVTPMHQQVKDEIAGRADGSRPEPTLTPAAPDASTAPDAAAPNTPVGDQNAPESDPLKQAQDARVQAATADAMQPPEQGGVGATGAPPAPGQAAPDAAAPAVATGDLSGIKSMSDAQLAAEADKAKSDFAAVSGQPRTSNAYTEAKLYADQIATEQNRRAQGGAIDAPSGTGPDLAGPSDNASPLAESAPESTPGAPGVDSATAAAPPALDSRSVITAAYTGQPQPIAAALAASYPAAYDGTGPTPEQDAADLVAARVPAMTLQDITDRNQRKQDAVTGEAPTAADDAAALLNTENTARLTADDVAEANATSDASYGVSEADDGQFEVASDISDRQDRVSGLLDASDAGNLDLAGQTDDGLRSTRADIVGEIKLQDHLAARDTANNGNTPTQGQRGASDSGDTTGGDDSTPDPSAPPAPKTRPGLAGAAEDHADALESGDADAITRTRARLEASLNRSKSDSEHATALRTLISSGADITPEQLRAAADAIRLDVKSKRNENARNRRTAKRLDREKLRSLLGQVDAEMRRRNLSYDPLPGVDDTTASGTPTTTGPTPGVWHDTTAAWLPVGSQTGVTGTGYSADINSFGGATSYKWQTTADDGTVTASGSGVMGDEDTARAAIAHALDAQQKLGRIPSDSTIPPLPATDTATQRLTTERSGVDAIRSRIADPTVNPVTGQPSPLVEARTQPPRVRAFDSPAAVRAHLAANVALTRDANGVNRDTGIDWAYTKLSPGGGLSVTRETGGKPFIMHNGTGASIQIVTNGHVPPLSKGDMLTVAGLLESMPDAKGNVINFADTDRARLNTALNDWTGPDGTKGYSAHVGAAMRELTTAKIQAGQWSDPVVRDANLTPLGGSGTNPSRRAYINDQHRNLTSLIGRDSNPARDDRSTLDLANGARTLADAGAPDAAAVALRRRAEELRGKEAAGTLLPAGTTADDHGAGLLDDLANAHLSMYSPTASPGTRAVSVQPGERFAFPENDTVRTYRVITPMRIDVDDKGSSTGTAAQVIDETTGQTLTAHISQGAGVSPMLTIRDTDGATPRVLQSTGLGNDGFVVLDPGQPAPEADGMKAAAFSEVSSIPTETLDRAAEDLPETRDQLDARRALAEPGGRAPARRSAAAPRRAAPAAVIAPSSDEQKLAQSQTTARNTWQKAPFETFTAPSEGGFQDFDQVAANAEALRAANPTDRDPKTASAQAAYLDNPASRSLPGGGAKLSPGGHLVVRKDGAIEQARSGQLAWTPAAMGRWGIDGGMVDTPSPALTARIADYMERANINGESIPWGGTPDDVKKSVAEISQQTGVHPMATITKAAYVDHLATVKRPTSNDIASFERMTSGVQAADVAPNPDVLTSTLKVGPTEQGYNALSGKRVLGDGLPGKAMTPEDVTLAKRISAEYALTRPQAKVAPLDATRRLNALADELDGRTIESADGQKVTPSADLRARAKAITDAYDESKPSPMGLLGRNNYDGTIVPDLSKADISVGSVAYNPSATGGGQANQGTRNVRASKLKSELRDGGSVKLEKGDSGNLRATLAGRTVEDGVDGGTVRANDDGSIQVAWREDLYGGSAQPTVNLPAGSWKLDGAKPTAPGSTISDDEYAAHTAEIEQKLGEAFAAGQSTDVLFTVGGVGQSWTSDRAAMHIQIVDELWQKNGANIPKDGRAVIAGGLGGAGKSTVLKGYAGIDASQFVTVNPDDVKEVMASKGMVPPVDGLSLMESSALVHEESSHIANMLAARAYAEKTNIVWDITMSRKASVEKRIAEMRAAGYTDVDAVFVDIPVETSVERALGRHRRGMEKAKAGDGLGGRYVPPSIIRQNSSDTSSSANRDTFDALQPEFDSWVVYDNSVAGREPQKIAGAGVWKVGGNQAAAVDPKAPADLTSLSDDDLDKKLTDATTANDFDALDSVIGEMERRESAAPTLSDADAREEQQWQHMQELLAQGYDEEGAAAEAYGRGVDQQHRDRAITSLRSQGYQGAGFTELARLSYRDHIYGQYISAEADTNGQLLNQAGRGAGIDPHSLFSGPESRVMKYGSDEVKAWFDQNGRVLFEQYQAGLLGDTAGAAAAGARTGGDDFLR